MGAFIKNTLILIGFGLAVLLFTEYLYRIKFLKGFTVVVDTTVDEKSISRQALIVNIILYLLLGGLLGYYAMVETPDGIMRYAFLALSVGGIGLGLRYIKEVIDYK